PVSLHNTKQHHTSSQLSLGVQTVNKRLRRFASDGPLTSNGRTLPAAFTFIAEKSIHRSGVLRVAISLFLLIGVAVQSRGDSTQQDQKTTGRLTQVTLEELGQIEVTTTSKEPVKAS